MKYNEFLWACGRTCDNSGEVLVEVPPSIGIIEEIEGVKYFKYDSDGLPVWIRLDLVQLYSTKHECEKAYMVLTERFGV